jgi:hypothetical protein
MRVVLTLRAALSAALLSGSIVTALAFGGCSSGTADPCKGGLLVDGQCVAKCEPALCVAGNTCVGNKCELVCSSYLDCLDDGSQSCLPAKEDGTGKAITTCQSNGKTPGIGLKCPVGTECAPGLRCITTGTGDADAYCTNDDCHADGDCVEGFYCGITHDPHEICGSTPKKGNNGFCGTTKEPCIDPAHFADGGKTLFEGSVCLLRHTCLKREPCAPCKTDLDCARRSGQKCVTIGSGQACARTCLQSSDCEPDAQCTAGACIPRAGACKLTGAWCDPCVNDEDCAGKGGGKIGCVQLSGTQHACLDFTFPVTCTADADCPKAPSGKNGTCLDERQQLTSADSNYHHCYFPIDEATNKTSCY